MNSVNRVMGTRDLYPFVLSPSALIKLDFIHRLIHDRALEARKRVVSRGGDDYSETENCLKSHASAAGRLRSHGMRVGVDVVTYPQGPYSIVQTPRVQVAPPAMFLEFANLKDQRTRARPVAIKSESCSLSGE
jgi:hypothetical protein